MQVKSLDDSIDKFEVEINTEFNNPIISETGEDILEEVEGDKGRKFYIISGESKPMSRKVLESYCILL